MNVLVCGGRNFTDDALIYATLDAVHTATPIDLLIQGGATGADNLADRWALRNNVVRLEVPANWAAEGEAAGVLRNARMLALGKPDLVIAFPGGRGTDDMIQRAEKAGVKVQRVQGDGG